MGKWLKRKGVTGLRKFKFNLGEKRFPGWKWWVK